MFCFCFVLMDRGANEQTVRMMVSDYRRPWKPTAPEESEKEEVPCRPFKGVWASGTLTHIFSTIIVIECFVEGVTPLNFT